MASYTPFFGRLPQQILIVTATDLQNTVASRQKLEGQRQENLGVQKVSIPPKPLILDKPGRDP